MKRRLQIFLASVVMVVSVVVLVTTTVRATLYAPQTEITPPPALTEPVAMLQPIRVVIPSIGVNAPTENLGLVAGNRIAAPSTFTSVGWYKYGPAPGQVGTAIMYGHLDNGLGLNGVFINLSAVAVGDDIQVTTKSGKILHFTIHSITAYPYLSVPEQVLENAAGDQSARLVIITCAGHWVNDPVEGMTYDRRLIVSATLTKIN